MTTRDFIKQTYNTTADRERRCSSVFTDYDGNVYSYGYHYPLVFNVDGINVVNTRGYSNTTAKHISWAWSAIDYDGVGVELPHGVRPSEVTREKLYYWLSKERQSVVDEMNSKKRKDTQVYQSLKAQAERLQDKMTEVQG